MSVRPFALWLPAVVVAGPLLAQQKATYKAPRTGDGAPDLQGIVDGYQAKDGTNKANGRDVTFADGRKLFLGSSGTGAPEK